MENFRKGPDCVTFYVAKSVLNFCLHAAYTGVDMKQEASGSTNVSEEEGRLQFWDE